MSENSGNSSSNISRRDILKGLAGVPVLGGLVIGAAAKYGNDQKIKEEILSGLDINATPPPPSGSMSGDPIRLGVIGYGIRGKQLMRALGYAHPTWKQTMKEAALRNSNDSRLRDFLEQENLNIKITAVCDIFDTSAKMAQEAGIRFGHQKTRRGLPGVITCWMRM